jgi:hypothetical protein
VSRLQTTVPQRTSMTRAETRKILVASRTSR